MKQQGKISKGKWSQYLFAKLNESFFKKIFHDLFFRNILVLKMLGISVPILDKKLPYGMNYGDLTTYLLGRKLSGLVRERKMTRVHEIGIGQYGILCIYLKNRFPQLVISGSTISSEQIVNSSRVALKNSCSINFFLADVLDRVEGTFDMIWWNLPYYELEVLSFIGRLFRQIKEQSSLVPGGLVLLGFNSVPLNADLVKKILDRYHYLEIESVDRFFWNPHIVLAIKYCPDNVKTRLDQ